MRVALLLLSLLVPCLAEDLTATITKLDAEVFDAYNRCDIDRFGKYFSDDVEFYHDEGGPSNGKAKLLESLKNNICGHDVVRVVVPGSIEVYPMKNFGAVQIGVHRFEHPKTPSNKPGIAKFVHLWQFKDGAWKITRVLSFDHKADTQ
jgi:hypothetical protein